MTNSAEITYLIEGQQHASYCGCNGCRDQKRIVEFPPSTFSVGTFEMNSYFRLLG